MPLPFIIAGAAAIAAGYGIKKGVDGHKSHSEADEIIKNTTDKYSSHRNKFNTQESKAQSSLEQLGSIELDIGASFG